jgi:hypothetical protein
LIFCHNAAPLVTNYLPPPTIIATAASAGVIYAIAAFILADDLFLTAGDLMLSYFFIA